MATVQTATTPGERLVRTRLWVGLEQRDMAELLGVSRNTVGNWERGVTDPPFSAVMKWAQITGRSMDWIAFGDEETEKAPTENGGGQMARPEGFEPPTF
ncbi:helix-turn-helix transcriptional regulator [Leucobacter sp.]